MNAKQRRRNRRLLAAGTEATNLRLDCEGAIEFKGEGGGSDKKLPTFSMRAYSGGLMRPMGFSRPVVVDLASTSVLAGARPILLAHDASKIVGHAEEVIIESKSIRVEAGVISGAGPAAEEVRLSAKNGFPWRASIGSTVGELQAVEKGQQVEINGQKFNGPLFVARDVLIHEVSFVSVAGDNRTSARVAASADPGSPTMTFEEWLAAKQYDTAKIPETLRAALKTAWELETGQKSDPPKAPAKTIKGSQAGGDKDDDDDPDPIAERRKLMASEAERVEKVHALCTAAPNVKWKTEGKPDNGLEAHAIGEGWTPEATELYILRASRPGPAIHTRSHDRDCTLEALQGALLLRCGGSLESKCYQSPSAIALGLPAWLRQEINAEQRQRAMEFAHRFSMLSALDLCREALRLDGRDAPYGRTELIAAATSGSALTNIFTTSVNARLLSTYMEAPDTTREWTQELDVADFKTNERIRLDVSAGLKALPRGTAAEHSKYTDSKESYKIKRYARQFVVDEQDFIDDNLQALETAPTDMGRAAARLRPDLVYAIIQDNANLDATARGLFNTTDGNALTTATLSAAQLRTAIATMLKFRENSVNLNISPTHILVPPDLFFLASELATSGQIIVSTGNTAGTERGVRNVIADFNLRVVSEGRLANGVTDPSDEVATTGSTTTWYLASALAPTIEVGFLRGSGRAPQVRNFQLSEGKWGMGWDVKMDIGAKALDWKGLVRNVA